MKKFPYLLVLLLTVFILLVIRFSLTSWGVPIDIDVFDFTLVILITIVISSFISVYSYSKYAMLVLKTKTKSLNDYFNNLLEHRDNAIKLYQKSVTKFQSELHESDKNNRLLTIDNTSLKSKLDKATDKINELNTIIEGFNNPDKSKLDEQK